MAVFVGDRMNRIAQLKPAMYLRGMDRILMDMALEPEIAAALGHFVLVELYTDGTDAASAQNQALQEKKFSTVAIPFYAILTPEEKVVASFPGLTRDTSKYLAFLQQGGAAKADEAGR